MLPQFAAEQGENGRPDRDAGAAACRTEIVLDERGRVIPTARHDITGGLQHG